MTGDSWLQGRADVAIDIAGQVGREAAQFRASASLQTLEVKNKGLQDFVTVADKRAERAIRERLLGLFKEDDFLGEETGGSLSDSGTWLIDPIDGTNNYLRGFRHWGVSVAFAVSGRIEIGVVYDASQDAVFSAIRGQGAFREGRAIRAAATCEPSKALAILGHSRKTSFEDHLALSRQLYERGIDYRRTGAASIDLLRVADGAADLFYERRLNVWDMAAGALIAKEAGAEVAMPQLDSLVAEGGSVIAYSPGLAGEFAFLLENEGLKPFRA